jgi:hypothetical protein
MRGDEGNQDVMFSYVKLERRVPSEHPLRAIRAMADMALRGLGRCERFQIASVSVHFSQELPRGDCREAGDA